MNRYVLGRKNTKKIIKRKALSKKLYHFLTYFAIF